MKFLVALLLLLGLIEILIAHRPDFDGAYGMGEYGIEFDDQIIPYWFDPDVNSVPIERDEDKHLSLGGYDCEDCWNWKCNGIGNCPIEFCERICFPIYYYSCPKPPTPTPQVDCDIASIPLNLCAEGSSALTVELPFSATPLTSIIGPRPGRTNRLRLIRTIGKAVLTMRTGELNITLHNPPADVAFREGDTRLDVLTYRCTQNQSPCTFQICHVREWGAANSGYGGVEILPHDTLDLLTMAQNSTARYDITGTASFTICL